MAAGAGKGRRRLVAASAGAAAVLILGTAGFVAMRPGDGGGTDLAARQTLPVVSPPAAADETAGPSVSPSAPGGAGPPGSPEPGGGGQPARTLTSRANGGTGTRTAASAGRSGGGNGAPAPGGQAPTQPVARVGAIGSPGGLCLDLNGGVVADGNFVDVFRCNGSNTQIWTVGTDGTLRAAGGCAQSLAADTAIAITGCDGRASTKWRAGANSSLVSVNIGQCLTDPGNGGSNGEAVRLSACNGNANQRFTLP
jgi:hypothetical protein